ncbi:MAG TPA: hypothetical protein VF533_19920 [Solirubrobacteraceae bacterium]
MDELRARFGRVLGLDGPVPVAAFIRATKDESYFGYLLTSRNAPGFLEPLLNDPANERYEPKTRPTASNSGLAGEAAKALVRWGRAGFSVADGETIRRREDACLRCPHLAEPTRRIQQILPSRPVADAVGRRTGDKVCSECGCQVAKKFRLPSEQCPVEDADRPGFTRWGEPVRAKGPVLR